MKDFFFVGVGKVLDQCIPWVTHMDIQLPYFYISEYSWRLHHWGKLRVTRWQNWQLFQKNWYAAQIYTLKVNNYYFLNESQTLLYSDRNIFLKALTIDYFFFPLNINTSHHSCHPSITKTALHCLSQTLIFLNVNKGTDKQSLHLIKNIKWTHVKQHIIFSNY